MHIPSAMLNRLLGMSLVSLTVLGSAGACVTTPEAQYDRRARAAEAIQQATVDEKATGDRAARRRGAQDRSADAAWLSLAADPDLRVAAAVRARILQEPTLSFDGKNVTIISDDGAVTLKGTVPSAAEGKKVAALARAVQGVRSVDDQLSVSNGGAR